jgi:C1A family cysteine protease
MRQGYALSLAVVGVVASAAVFAVNSFTQSTTSLYTAFTAQDQEFMKYVSEFSKSYGTKEEFEFRGKHFKNNLGAIMMHNSMNGNTYSLGINEFADYTPEEFSKLLGYKASARRVRQAPETVEESEPVEAGQYVDWRSQGAVNAVKNQGSCGSCWAFSTIGALEGAHKLQNSALLNLSEQQLVDCSKENENAGCNGGLMDDAFTHLKTHASVLQSDYPYTGRDGTCAEASKKGQVKVTSFTDVIEGDQNDLVKAVLRQPVSVAIEADRLAFQFYSKGILDGTACGQNLDHGVTAVGFGVENGKEYFIVRNSWGASWGESGYIRIAKNDSVKGGVCGIALAASYPDKVVKA